MPTPYVRPTRYKVNLLPGSIGFYAQQFDITVEQRGVKDRWAVLRHDQVLGTDGAWSDQLSPSERDDNWLDAHRFDLDTALRLAKEAAPHVTVKGRTAAEVLTRLIATGRITHSGGNAEDCPVCHGTNPDYPFICPGPAAVPPAVGARQPKETQPPTAYSDGKGRTYCLPCATRVSADVPLTIDEVDHWELCPSCGRHVVDVARGAEQPKGTQP
jgi:hypothetical protein